MKSKQHDPRFHLRNRQIRDEVDGLMEQRFGTSVRPGWTKSIVLMWVAARHGLNRTTVHQIYHQTHLSYMDDQIK